jgi:hypothetical protein
MFSLVTGMCKVRTVCERNVIDLCEVSLFRERIVRGVCKVCSVCDRTVIGVVSPHVRHLLLLITSITGEEETGK